MGLLKGANFGKQLVRVVPDKPSVYFNVFTTSFQKQADNWRPRLTVFMCTPPSTEKKEKDFVMK